MFYTDGILVKSTLLDTEGVAHAFSTRLGGVSTLPHTREMNIAEGHGDSAEIVRENVDILARLGTEGAFSVSDTVLTKQIHSAKVRVIDKANCGEGTLFPVGEECDGFVTDVRGVVPIVRTADCVPILMIGRKSDYSPVVAALHAGWRGTVMGIAAEGVSKMLSLGAELDSVKVAIGPHIEKCCFEVGEDFLASVVEMRGEAFAARHIDRGESLHADLTSMNVEILLGAGVKAENIDVSGECTCCDGTKYHSHRRGRGVRGTMGSLIAIL